MLHSIGSINHPPICNVETIVGKGEIGVCQQFLLFPQCFQKHSFSILIKTYGCVVIGYIQCTIHEPILSACTNNKAFSPFPTMFSKAFFQLFTSQSRLLTTLKTNALENTVGKGENAGSQHFLLFPRCFLFYQRENSSF